MLDGMKYAHDITDLAPIEVIEQAYRENKYIVTTHGVFQIHYSQAQQCYTALRLIITELMLTKKEYELLTGRQVNNRLEMDIVVE